MKNPKRNPVERFCALLLAFIMVFTLVLPDGALSVSAAGNNSDEASGEPEASTEKTTDVEVTIFEKVPTTENPDNKVAIQGADLQIKEADTDNVVANGQSDANGKVKVENLTYDTEKSYEYTVSKAGYQSLENKSVSIGTVNEVEVTLEMSDISLGDLSAVELSPNKEGVPSQVQAVINNKIDNFEVGGAAQYKWESSNPAVADVDGNGLITAKGRGSATITVSRNGKSAQTTIKVKEVPSMELNVTPDNGTDVKSVTAKASLPTDAAGGTVTFSVNGADNVVNVAADGTAELILNGAVMGTLNISAVYSGNELYYEASASTNGSYKQSKDITLKDEKNSSNTTITYGVNEVPALSVFDAEDRVVTFSSSDSSVIEATPDGKLTVKGEGTAKIIATAAESDNYTEASASYEVTVNKNTIKNTITFADFEWNVADASKVYDGNKKIRITGTLKNADVIDNVQVTVSAQLKKSGVGSYSEFTVTDDDADINLKGANNYKITTDFSNKNVQLAEGKTVNITPRPVYVKVAVKEGKTTKFAYGTIKADLQTAVEENYEVVLAGKYEDGNILEPDKEQGLLSPAKLELKNYAKVALKGFNDNNTVYYVGGYTAEVIPVITNKNAGNYEIRVDSENIAKYSSDLTIEKEKETQASLNDLVKIVGADGIYQNEKDGSVYIRGNQAVTLKLEFKETNAYYDQIWVSKGEKQADGQEIYYDAINSGISFDDSKDKEYTLKVSLRNSKNAETVTDGVEYQKITVDAISPTADFKDLGNAGQFNKVLPNNWKGFGNFSKDKIKKYLVTSDDATSKVKSLKTCKITVDNDDAEAIVEKISEAVKNDSVWEETSSVETSSVKFDKEGNYIVLALVEDNVGNKAVYASNGLVFDLTAPDVSVKIIEPEENTGCNQKVNFTVEINDKDITSGVDKIEVIAMDSDKDEDVTAEYIETVKVAGGFDEDNKMVIDSCTLNSEKINTIVGSEQDGTLQSIQAHANFTVNGELSINKYQSGYAIVKVIVYDKAGNNKEITTKREKVDVVAPKVNVKYDKDSATNSKYINSSERTMTITYTERNFIKSGLRFKVSVNGTESDNLTLDELEALECVTVNGPVDSENGSEPDNYKDDRTNTYQITFSGDGAYEVIPKITDAAGNTNMNTNGKIEIEYENSNSQANELFVLDSTAPTVDVKYSPEKSVRENEYFNSKRTMTLTITERNFDESTLKFKLVSDGETVESDNKSDTEKEKVLTMKDLTEKGLVIKKTEDKEAEVNEEKRTDARKIVYEIEFNNDGFYQLIPYLTDLAGNEYNGSIESEITKYQEFCIDKKAPEVTVKYNDNELTLHNDKYFNQQRTAEVTIKERNFNADDLEFTLTRDGDKQTYKGFSALEQAIGKLKDCDITEIKDSEEKTAKQKHTDERVHTFSITFGQKGEDYDYKISVKTTDLAGNSNDSVKDENIGAETVATGKEFTVDMLAPSFSISYELLDDEGNVSSKIKESEVTTNEDKRVYKNKTIKAKVTIEERNFKSTEDVFKDSIKVIEEATDVAGVAVEVKNQQNVAESLDKWNAESGTIKYTNTGFVFEEEANYTFNLSYTDLAGNTAELVPQSDKGYRFTVDKTAPTGSLLVKNENLLERLVEKLLDEVSFKFFNLKSKSIEVTTKGLDVTSPIKVSYYKDWQDGHGDFDALEEEALSSKSWTKLNLKGREEEEEKKEYNIAKEEKEYSYLVEKDEQFVPYARIEDKAGNIVYLNNDGIICESKVADININIDTKKPSTAAFEVKEEDVVYNGNVEFNIDVKDEATKDKNNKKDVYSGINEIKYEVYSAESPEGADGNVKGTISFEPSERVQYYNIPNIKIPVKEQSRYNSNDVTIKVTVIDNAGNENYDTKNLKIDITDPSIDVSYNNNDVKNETYFKNNRTMTIKYTERNITPDGLTFDFVAGDVTYKKIKLEKLRSEISEKNLGITISEGKDSQASVDAKDYTDDRTLTYSITFDGGKEKDMDYQIIPYIEDLAGNTSYKTDESGKIIDNVKYANGKVASQKFTVDKVQPEMNVSYYLVDSNGNRGEKIEVSTDKINRLYKNKTIRAVVKITERNFALENGFSEEDKQVIPHFTWTNYDGNQGSVADYEAAATNLTNWLTSDKVIRTQSFDFIADGDYSFTMEYTDLAGNSLKEEYGTHYCTVDKTAPKIHVEYTSDNQTVQPGEIELNRLYKNKDITATVTIEERNFQRENNAVNFENGQMSLSYTAKNLQGSDINTENYTGTANTRGEWSTNVYTRTKTFTFSQDANYTLGLVYRDLAGNEAVYDTRYFTVDKTAPTGSMTIEDNSGTAKTWIQWIQQVFFDIFTQSQKGVSMTSADETAGVASTQYYKYHPDSESRHTFDGLSTQNLDSISSWSDGYSTSVNADEQVIVYEKITDRAGNVTYINNQEGVIADNTSPTAPEIKITAAEPAQGIYNASVPFTIDVTDPENGGTYAGLKEVSYEITNNGKVTQSGNYNSDLSDPTARVHNIHRSETVNAELNNSNHVTIKVKAVDYAGNQSEATKDLKIDITHPEVTITFDLNNPLNGKYYKTTRTATISVKERNFDTNAVDLKITNTDGTMPSVSGWSISSQAGESDDAINTCRVEFSADGDYNMTMQCKDQAGNESNTVKVDEFTIDKTIPVISVSYDNNSAATPGYYNANRTATITIKEHNFNAAEVNSQITAALQGSGISAPGVGGWSNSGDTHTASVTFSDDGDYTFDIDYTDLAGNAAADYTQDSFTVDKTKPEVEFFDIEDKSANNGVVAPGVKYSDVNYLESGVEIKIEGAEHESKELTGSRSSIANGESIKMNDFEYTQDNDDVYTMTAVISDKAGNKTEKKIMFSVNRFGSNYSFSDTTKEFLDEVYSNSAKDLVITETNVDSLVFNGISYSLDNKTTELKQGTDYTVKETGGEGSWKQYTYTIKKENFEKEGRYSVTIDSEDKATNTMNNKVKERNINFVIDKTPPTVVITGIEESSYRADSRDMSVNVSDNTAVKRLDIMVDGKSVATYSQEDVKEAGGKIVYTLNSSNSKQKVKAVAVDMADNEATSDNHNILITTNLFIQYINNKPLFIGSIIALVLIAGGAIYFFVFRRKKSEDAADAN